MNKVLVLLLVLFSFSACDKVKKTEKKISGVWTIYQYKFENALGLIYYYPVSGTMDFGSCGGDQCQYALRADYEKDGANLTKYEDGTINLTDTDKFSLDRIEADGTITHLDEGRFLLLTKDDIKLIFQDETGVHEFILQP